MDLVDAGYASSKTGCFTARGACGELSCFSRWALCVLTSSSLPSLRTGVAAALTVSLVSAMLGAATSTAMLNLDDNAGLVEFWGDNGGLKEQFFGEQWFVHVATDRGSSLQRSVTRWHV